VTDRDAAEGLVGSRVLVAKATLPRGADDEFYWFELTGLTVETVHGETLGQVSGLMETGAHDVLIVAGDRERLIPYTPGVHVRHVDLTAGRLVADWDPEF
jgi:16S rRNA processing protein RimM